MTTLVTRIKAQIGPNENDAEMVVSEIEVQDPTLPSSLLAGLEAAESECRSRFGSCVLLNWWHWTS